VIDKILCGVDTLALEERLGADGWVAGLECISRETVAVTGGKAGETKRSNRNIVGSCHYWNSIFIETRQYIKLAASEAGIGSEYVRAPRLILEVKNRNG
jgi:4-hydroxy-tetrahydrodipicolinate synthase